MADAQFLRINDKWALAHDDRQWVLQRCQGIDKRSGKNAYSAVSFVSSNKAVLARVMREKCVPQDAAAAALAKLPDTFREFLASRHENVLGSAVLPSDGVQVPANANAAVHHPEKEAA